MGGGDYSALKSMTIYMASDEDNNKKIMLLLTLMFEAKIQKRTTYLFVFVNSSLQNSNFVFHISYQRQFLFNLNVSGKKSLWRLKIQSTLYIADR